MIGQGQMHEETRRRLLCAAFGLLCLVPTASVIAWSLVRALPFQTRRLEWHLQQQIGAHVRIGSISSPRPHQRHLRDVTILDVESKRELARLPRIDAINTDQGWQLIIPDATVPQAALRTLWQLAHQRLLRDDAIAERIVHVAMDRLVLTSDQTELQLHDVNWSRGRKPDVQHSNLLFALPGSSPSQGVKVELHRDRSTPVPQTRVVLDTGDTSLPVSLIGVLMGHDWKTDARFRGRLPWVTKQNRWHAEFVGQLFGLDLDDLAPTWIPFEVSGQATINVTRCTFDQRGVQAIHGLLSVQELVAPHKLIESLVDFGLFAPGTAFAETQSDTEFTANELSLTFTMDQIGLACKGIPDQAGLPVAVMSQAGPLLLSDAHLRINYLICALIPENVEGVYQARARLIKALPRL